MDRSGNATLERVWRTLEPFLRTYITIVSPGIDRRAVADRHLPIIEALRSRRPELVEEAYRVHFEEAAAALAKVWPVQGGDTDSDPEHTPADPVTSPAR